MTLQVITPPEAISQKVYKDSINIFLAGSIERGKAEDWQQTCINYLDKRWTADAITLLNPRRKDWNSKKVNKSRTRRLRCYSSNIQIN